MSNVFLYMTMSLDGFVAGPDGELDWMTSTQDPELTADIVTLLRRADAGFIGYPTAVGMRSHDRLTIPLDDPLTTHQAMTGQRAERTELVNRARRPRRGNCQHTRAESVLYG